MLLITPDEKQGPSQLLSFVILFHIGYFSLCMISWVVFPYPFPVVASCALLLLFPLSHIAGIMFGRRYFKYRSVEDEGHAWGLFSYFIICSIAAVMIAEIFSWQALFEHYGGISEFFRKAPLVRREAVCVNPKPVPFYLRAVDGMVIALVSLAFAALKRKVTLWRIAIAVIAIALTLIDDLRIFGRQGMIFVCFCFVGIMWLRGIGNAHIWRLRNIFLAVLLFGLMMIPAIIRSSDPMKPSGTSAYYRHMRYQLPRELSPVVHALAYYCSSPFAFDQWLRYDGKEVSFGEHTFGPVWNLSSRFLGTPRFTSADSEVFVPFSHNIFTIVRDLYSDFGMVGLILLPFLWGIVGAFLFSRNGLSADALKIFYLAWVCYTPCYSILRFPPFFWSFILLLLLACVENTRWIQEH